MAFPQTPIQVRVEALTEQGPIDITSLVRVADGIQIARGRPSEGTSVDPTTLTMTLSDPESKLVLRNRRSQWHGLIKRGTPISVQVLPEDDYWPDVFETFPVTSTSGWPATSGAMWTMLGEGGAVAATDLTVSGGQGRMLVSAAGAWRGASTASRVSDADVLATVVGPAPTGDAWYADIMGRATPTPAGGIAAASWLRVECRPGQPIRLFCSTLANGAIRERFAIDGVELPTTHVGQSMRVRARWVGPMVVARAWPSADAEPTNWQLVWAPRVHPPTTGEWVLRTTRHPSNTNTGLVVAWDNIVITPHAQRAGGVELSSIEPRGHLSNRGELQTARLSAHGATRRLRQGAPVVQSPQRKSLARDSRVVAAWLLEDGGEAMGPGSQWAGLTAASQPMTVTAGQTGQQRITGLSGSGPIPTIGTSSAWGVVSPAPAPTSSTAAWVTATIPDAGVTGDTVILTARSAGSIPLWRMSLIPGPTWNFRVQAWDSTGVQVVTSTTTYAVVAPVGTQRFSLELTQSGGNISWAVGRLPELADGGFVVAGGTVAGTVGPWTAAGWAAGPDPGLGIGAIVLWSQAVSIYEASGALRGHRDETIRDRVIRLGATDGALPVVVPLATDPTTGLADSIHQVGIQPTATALEVLEQAVQVDGVLIEDRVTGALRWRSGVELSTVGRAGGLTLSWTGRGQVADVALDYTTQRTRNAVTARRAGGAEVTLSRDAGPLSTQPPPVGLGRIETAVELGLRTDDQVANQASYRLEQGQIDEPRVSRVSVLGHAMDSWMLAALTELEVGSILELGDAPTWVTGDTATPASRPQLQIEGWTETIRPFEWTFDFATTPWAVRRPMIVGLGAGADSAPRADTMGSSLRLPITAASTVLLVQADIGPRWTTSPADVPLQLDVDGEPVDISSITARVQLATTPVPTAVAAPWLHQAGTGMVVSRSIVAGGGPSSQDLIRATVTTAASGGNTGHLWRADGITTGASGQVICCSMWVRTSASGVTITLSLTPRSAGVALAATSPSGADIGGVAGATVTLTPGVWRRLSWSVVAPSSWDGVQVWAVHPATQLPLGATTDATQVLVEVAPAPLRGPDITSSSPPQSWMTCPGRSAAARDHASGVPVALWRPGRVQL